MTVATKSVAQVARDAADHIEKVGHYKGFYFKDEGPDGEGEWSRQLSLLEDPESANRPCCIVGALYVATDALPLDARNLDERAWEIAVQIEDWLDMTGPRKFLPDWNDAPQTTAEDVTKVLRDFADYVENKENV